VAAAAQNENKMVDAVHVAMKTRIVNFLITIPTPPEHLHKRSIIC
jgi:hypothetical protein